MIQSTAPASAVRRSWGTLPRRTPTASPLEEILGERASVPFTPVHIERLRAHVARSIPKLPVPELDMFLGALMDCTDIVSAYFRPTRVLAGSPRQPLVEVVLPFDCAMEAARKAAAMPTLLPQERSLAWLGAFAYPLAHFFIADPARGPSSFTDALTPDYVESVREALLEDALRVVRTRNPALANTLAAALGLPDVEGCDAQQVARLASAIRLATLRIEQLWKEVGDV